MPVVSSATCTISNDDLDKGCDTDETTRDYARKLGGHDGVDDDDAGHILAHRLGGSGSEPTNICARPTNLLARGLSLPNSRPLSSR